MIKFSSAVAFIIFLIDFIFLVIVLFEFFYSTLRVIQNHWLKNAISKSFFSLQNNLKVHNFFLRAILVIKESIISTNKKMVYKFLIGFFYYSITFWLAFNPNDFKTDFQIFQLSMYCIWIVIWFPLLFFALLRYIKIKKVIKISNNLILDNQNILFNVEFPNDKDILEILHSGTIENLKNGEFSSKKKEENYIIKLLYIKINTSRIYSIYDISKEKLLLNRDFIAYNLNGDKQKARYIHYLMIVYSNYQNEKFYIPNHQDNMQYFMHLEKYYQ